MNRLLYSVLERAEWTINFGMTLISRAFKPAHRASTQRTVLIVRPDAIGDFVLFSAVLPVYRSLFPDAYLILLVSTDVYELARECPFVDAVWQIDVRRFRYDIPEKIRWLFRLLNAQIHVAIFPVYSLALVHTEFLIGWTRAPRRIGYECSELGKKRRRMPNYTELVPARRTTLHELSRNEDFVRYLGYHGEPVRKTFLWLPRHSDRLEEWTQRPIAVIAPGARISIKAWSWQRFAEVVSRLNETYELQWLIVGSQAEREAASAMCEALAAVGVLCRNLAGQTSLSEVASILEKCVVCLGNDSGVIHMAQSLGVPTVVVAGGGHFGRFVPYPDGQGPEVVHVKLDCYGCHWRCVYETPRCLEEVTVEMVYRAVVRTLNRFVRQPSGGLQVPQAKDVSQE